jgi:ribosomal protein S18 acetylase RimI-like enzyme
MAEPAIDDVQVMPTAEQYAEGFNAAVDIVARERRYIGLVEGPSIESTRTFVRKILDGGGVQMLAVTPSGGVVGWCDILRNPNEGFRHVGRLGMGLIPEYRGRGWGRELAVQAIRAARKAGMERVELEVFASNKPAIALYRSLGFVVEGIKRRARKLDGEYDDNVFMALLDEHAGP